MKTRKIFVAATALILGVLLAFLTFAQVGEKDTNLTTAVQDI